MKCSCGEYKQYDPNESLTDRFRCPACGGRVGKIDRHNVRIPEAHRTSPLCVAANKRKHRRVVQ